MWLQFPYRFSTHDPDIGKQRSRCPYTELLRVISFIVCPVSIDAWWILPAGDNGAAYTLSVLPGSDISPLSGKSFGMILRDAHTDRGRRFHVSSFPLHRGIWTPTVRAASRDMLSLEDRLFCCTAPPEKTFLLYDPLFFWDSLRSKYCRHAAYNNSLSFRYMRMSHTTYRSEEAHRGLQILFQQEIVYLTRAPLCKA